MKIAIIGYGRMGQAIERTARQNGHEITLTTNDLSRVSRDILLTSEVAIEFSRPEAAAQNVITCLEAGIPVVCGTTGWLENGGSGPARFGRVGEVVDRMDGAFFYASNFSIGVNLFFRLNRYLATLTSQLPEYQAHLTETHHVHKLDAPSGTAITLAEGLIAGNENYHSHYLAALQNPKDSQPQPQSNIPSDQTAHLPITAIRRDEVPGTHAITYASSIDRIHIEHEAFGREGFVSGALAAAEWLPGKRGVFGMDDLLGEKG